MTLPFVPHTSVTGPETATGIHKELPLWRFSPQREPDWLWPGRVPGEQTAATEVLRLWAASPADFTCPSWQSSLHSPLDSSRSTRHNGLVERVQRDPRRMVSPLRRYPRHISFPVGGAARVAGCGKGEQAGHPVPPFSGALPQKTTAHSGAAAPGAMPSLSDCPWLALL